MVIGNADYLFVAHLKNPINDAKLIKDSLQACGFTVIEKENLKETEFQPVVEQFFDSLNKAPCEAFFYYSGHGIQKDGENYLIPVDANISNPADIEGYCFALRKVLGKLDFSKSSINIIVLDACRNNPFSTGFKDLNKGLNMVTKAPHESFIVYATDPNNVASDGNGRNSPLAVSFARHMREAGLSINGLLIKVINEVTAQYPNQRPWGSISINKEYYFVPESTASVPENTRQISVETSGTSGLAEISFVANADCALFINDERATEFGDKVVNLKAMSPQLVKRIPGNYRIRAQSLYDPSIYIDTICGYEMADPTITFLDLQSRFRQREDSLESDPLNAARRRIVGEIEKDMVKMPAGEFEMGNKTGKNDEIPVHPVTLRAFYIGRFEITQDQWAKIMGYNPSSFKDCADCPVENVSWIEAQKFIKTLDSLSGKSYRLPTEAEWEFAARGGGLAAPNGNKFSGGNKSDRYGWTHENSADKPHPVGAKYSNERGIFDMTGNVSEWCSDVYDGSYYNNSPPADPAGPVGTKSKGRVVRGGSYIDYDSNCTNFTREGEPPETKSYTIGFRLALTAE